MNTTHVVGATSKIVTLRAITISTGLPYTGGAFNTSGLVVKYTKDGSTPTTITTVTASAGTWTSSGFVHRGQGVYEVGVPNAAFSSTVDGVEITADGITDVLFTQARVELVAVDPRSSAAVDANVTKWNGTTVATPATAGYPAVTVKVGTGTGEVNSSGGKVPATIAAGDLATDSVTAAALKADGVTKIANATVEAEITALLTYNRSANTTGTITGPTSGSNALGLSTDATYLPIKTL